MLYTCTCNMKFRGFKPFINRLGNKTASVRCESRIIKRGRATYYYAPRASSRVTFVVAVFVGRPPVKTKTHK